MTFWQKRLDMIADGSAPLPEVTQKLELGRLKSWREGFAEKEWQVESRFCTGSGTSEEALFGGYIAGLADQMAAFVTMTVVEDGQHFRTVELKLSYFSKIRVGAIRVEGRVVHRSRSVLHVDVDFLSDGKLMARGSAIEMFVQSGADLPRPDAVRPA